MAPVGSDGSAERTVLSARLRSWHLRHKPPTGAGRHCCGPTMSKQRGQRFLAKPQSFPADRITFEDTLLLLSSPRIRTMACPGVSSRGLGYTYGAGSAQASQSCSALQETLRRVRCARVRARMTVSGARVARRHEEQTALKCGLCQHVMRSPSTRKPEKVARGFQPPSQKCPNTASGSVAKLARLRTPGRP